MAPNYGLLSTLSARLSSKVRGGGYVYCTELFYEFYGIWNHAIRNGHNFFELSKSTLGQVKLSIEVHYITLAQFLDFLEGLFSVSAHCAGAGARTHTLWITGLSALLIELLGLCYILEQNHMN